MGTTAVSSGDVGTAINAYMPRWAGDWVYSFYDSAVKQHGGIDIVARQHQSRTDNLEDLIAEYLSVAVECMPLCHRTGMIRNKMKAAKKRGDLDHVPSLKTIRRLVYKLAKR